MIIGNLSLGCHSIIRHCFHCILFIMLLFGCSNKEKGQKTDDKIIKIYLPENNYGHPVIDEITKLSVYSYVENMPQYKGGQMDLLHDFSSVFQHRFKKDEMIQTNTVVMFVIDTTGALVGERIYGKAPDDLTGFERDVLIAIYSLQSWTCGRINGSNVNVLMTFPIHIDSQLRH